MGTHLFVGNLSDDTLEADLRAVFTAGGFAIAAITMVKDPESGRPRGFAFVELESAAVMSDVLARLERHELKGRAITVRETKERPATYHPGGPSAAPVASAALPTQEAVVSAVGPVRST
jgi:RNA recognition motif-containing protein